MRPYFETVDLPVISDLSTQQLLLNKGQLHGILHDLNAPAVKSYLGNDGVASYSLPSFTTEQAYVNPNAGLLKDPAARRAFQSALDVETLRKQVFEGRSEAATGNYPPGLIPAELDKQDVTAGTEALAAIAAKASRCRQEDRARASTPASRTTSSWPTWSAPSCRASA